jgi:hypothetical protein
MRLKMENKDLSILEKKQLKIMKLAGKAVIKEDIKLLKELAKY